MIRFRVQELIADKQFAEDRVVTLAEISNATGISRVTLSKLINQRGYTTGTDNLDTLCRYFGCGLDQLAVYIPDEMIASQTKKKVAPTKKHGPGKA